MRRWAGLQGRALGETLARMAASPFATLSSVLVMAVALSLPVLAYVGLGHLQGFSRQLSADPQISLFLDTEASAADAGAIERRLRADPDVSAFRFISRESALAELKRGAELAGVLDNLRQNPLPDAFVVTARSTGPDLLEVLRARIAAWPRVAHVQLDSDWARKLDALLRLGRSLAAVFGALLCCLVAAVSFNTIRLQIVTRREEMEVMRLIGATRPFIRRPFLYFGAIQGLLGGLLTLAIVALALWALNRDLAALESVYGGSFRLHPPGPQDSARVLGFSSLLGWLGAWLSVRRAA